LNASPRREWDYKSAVLTAATDCLWRFNKEDNMLRNWLIVALFISFWALPATNAHAYPSTTNSSGGWGIKLGSIIVWSDWWGTANSDQKPTSVVYTIENLKVELHYLNPNGRPGGIGTPFFPTASLTAADTIQPLSGKGYIEDSYEFTDAEIIQAIEDAGELPPPPNGYWILDTSDITVLELDVHIQAFSDLDKDANTTYCITTDNCLPGGTEALTVDLLGHCVLNYDMTSYTCTTSSYVYAKKGM
jgi:hypothetical protein